MLKLKKVVNTSFPEEVNTLQEILEDMNASEWRMNDKGNSVLVWDVDGDLFCVYISAKARAILNERAGGEFTLEDVAAAQGELQVANFPTKSGGTLDNAFFKGSEKPRTKYKATVEAGNAVNPK